MNTQELEKRLIDFAVSVIDLSSHLYNSDPGLVLRKQIVRSGTSSALNYGEAQSAESRKDFIHKMKVCLKELRESFITLRIIQESQLCRKKDAVESLIIENNELISIFVASIKTSTTQK